MNSLVFAPQRGEKKGPHRIGDGGDEGALLPSRYGRGPHLPHCLRQWVPLLSRFAGEDNWFKVPV